VESEQQRAMTCCYVGRLFDDVSNSDASIEHVRNMFEPFVLRRVKQDILTELVPKKQLVQYVEMTPTQKTLYQTVIAAAKSRGSKHAAIDAENVVVLDGSDDDAVSGGSAGTATTPHSVASESIGSGDDDDVELVVPNGPEVHVPERTVNHVFTELRKACNHPLLSGQLYVKDPEVCGGCNVAVSLWS
jgi:SNF2 family DNA or RNA helicase